MSWVVASVASSTSETVMPAHDHIEKVLEVLGGLRMNLFYETAGPNARPRTTANTMASVQPIAHTATARAVLV